MAYMDYMDLDVCRLRKAVKLNHSLSHSEWCGLLYLLSLAIITSYSEVIMCLFVSMFVTMFVQTIYLWKTGATQTVFCKYIIGDV